MMNGGTAEAISGGDSGKVFRTDEVYGKVFVETNFY